MAAMLTALGDESSSHRVSGSGQEDRGWGFETAVSVIPGLNVLDQNRFELRRLSVVLEFAEQRFREEVAGLHV